MKTTKKRSSKGRIANNQSPIADPNRTVARMVVVPESKIPVGSKLCVVLVGKDEMQAIYEYLVRVPKHGNARAKTLERLLPVLSGIARSWVMGD
ncbi:MAG: hypothetical protein ABFD89_06780 [Bryobacteraceae bacterium]